MKHCRSETTVAGPKLLHLWMFCQSQITKFFKVDSNAHRICILKSYSPEGNRTKHYIFGLGVVILILLITIIVIETSGLESSSGGGGKFKLELFDHDLFQQNNELSGTYRLDTYDDDFEKYLLSLDIPKFAIGMIQASKEMITVAEPSNSNPNWTLTMRTGMSIALVMLL